MSYRKVNPLEERDNAIENDPQLKFLMKVSDNKYELIKSLVEYRKDKGITQKEISEISGLSQHQVSRIEKITYEPTMDIFMRYITALNIRLTITNIRENK